MLKKILLALFVVFAVIGSIGGVKALQIKALIAAGANPPVMSETVSTTAARVETWRSTIQAVGSFAAVQGVTVSAEMPGLVSALHFESGEEVEKGQLLAEIDASTELAQLKAAQAQERLTKLRFDRSRELRDKNTVAQAELDTAEAQFLEAQAQVANLDAVIAKKRIVAPFAGRLGIREINLGQFLSAGTPIVSLQAVDPVFADFTLPQQRVGEVSAGMEVIATVDTYPGREFKGKLDAIAPAVSTTTRSVSLRASFENDDLELRPGMFATFGVVLPEQRRVLVVPSTAVLFAPYGDSVYLVEDGENGKVAHQKFVRVLERRGDFTAIEAGLEEGDPIVSSGVFKLRNGVSVIVNNNLAPNAKLNPEPEDA